MGPSAFSWEVQNLLVRYPAFTGSFKVLEQRSYGILSRDKPAGLFLKSNSETRLCRFAVLNTRFIPGTLTMAFEGKLNQLIDDFGE